MDLKSTIEKIRNEIKEHEYNYLVLDTPTISEYEFESLKLELKKLESEEVEKSLVLEIS